MTQFLKWLFNISFNPRFGCQGAQKWESNLNLIFAPSLDLSSLIPDASNLVMYCLNSQVDHFEWLTGTSLSASPPARLIPPFSAVSAHPGYICQHVSTSLNRACIVFMEGMQ